MKNRRYFQLVCLLLAAITALLPLTACGGDSALNYPHPERMLHPGETETLQLEHIPVGYVWADYEWTVDDPSVVKLDGMTVTALRDGTVTVTAEAEYRGTIYRETYPITVKYQLESFRISESHTTLFVDESKLISVQVSPALAEGDAVEWTADDQGSVRLVNGGDPKDPHNLSCQIVGVKKGTSVVTASVCGEKVECVVNVYDASDPLSNWTFVCADADAQNYTADTVAVDKTVDMERRAVLDEACDGMIGTAPNGKYIVRWDYLLSPGSAAVPQREYAYTGLLPPSIRADDPAEAEFVIHVTEGEAFPVMYYEMDVVGMCRTAEIRLEDLQGNVLETYYAVNGPDLPESILVPESEVPEYYYGDYVDLSRMQEALDRVLKDLWEEYGK